MKHVESKCLIVQKDLRKGVLLNDKDIEETSIGKSFCEFRPMKTKVLINDNTQYQKPTYHRQPVENC